MKTLLISLILVLLVLGAGCFPNLEKVSPDFYGYWLKVGEIKEGEIYKLKIWPTEKNISIVMWQKSSPKDKIYLLSVSYYSTQSNTINIGDYNLTLIEKDKLLFSGVLFERIVLKE